MTLRLPDGSKRARIVLQIAGPMTRLQLRHVPTDWVIVSIGMGPDLTASAEYLRRAAIRRGYDVAPELTREDWNPRIRGMMRA